MISSRVTAGAATVVAKMTYVGSYLYFSLFPTSGRTIEAAPQTGCTQNVF